MDISNICPLSLLLNVEANAVGDAAFTEAVVARLDATFAVSTEVVDPMPRGPRLAAPRF